MPTGPVGLVCCKEEAVLYAEADTDAAAVGSCTGCLGGTRPERGSMARNWVSLGKAV